MFHIKKIRLSVFESFTNEFQFSREFILLEFLFVLIEYNKNCFPLGLEKGLRKKENEKIENGSKKSAKKASI